MATLPLRHTNMQASSHLTHIFPKPANPVSVHTQILAESFDRVMMNHIMTFQGDCSKPQLAWDAAFFASCIVWESRSQKNLWSTRLTYTKNNFCKFNVFHKFLSYSFLQVIISILYKFQVSIGIQICGIAVIDHCGAHAEHLDFIFFFKMCER